LLTYNILFLKKAVGVTSLQKIAIQIVKSHMWNNTPDQGIWKSDCTV